MMRVSIKVTTLALVVFAIIAGVYYVNQNNQQSKSAKEEIATEIVCDDGTISLFNEKCEPLPDGAYLVADDTSFEDCETGYYVEYGLSYPKNSFICLKIPERGFKVESYDWDCEYPYVRGLVELAKRNKFGCSIPPENSYITRDCGSSGWDTGIIVPEDCGAKYWMCHDGYIEDFINDTVICKLDVKNNN